MKNFFIKEYVPSTPTICVGNFVVGGQGKTPFVRYIREKFEKQKEFAGGNTELKDKINNAFITIRNQYSDYLNKTKLINKEE